ncbi:MAG: response regulator [Candidatus Zapsychrus exili]|nr:response regulator [Candidatus Zapsychrus exili]
MKRILIIYDEKGFASMLKLNLEATGKYDVRVEDDPRKAIYAALEHRPQLILLDIIMPNMEGPDVAIALKNNDVLKDVPIVFLTATIRKSEADVLNSNIGGYPFVAKPSTLNELLDSIERNIAVIE